MASETPKYKLYVCSIEEESSTSVRDWMRNVAGNSSSNMTKLEDVLTQNESALSDISAEVNKKIDAPSGAESGHVLTYDGTTWVSKAISPGGVTSFNGRNGAIMPQTGDYTADMVDARPNTWTPSAAETGAIPDTEKGVPSGVATLDDAGKVPTEQLPAMNYDPAGSSAAVQTNLDAHISNKNNPHAVTTEQIGAVPNTRTVNGKPLSDNISLDAVAVGARPSSWTPSAAEVGAIPSSEKGTPSGVASLDETGKVLAGQLPAMNYDPAGSAQAVQTNLDAHISSKINPHAVTTEQIGAVPTTRKVNGKPLSADVSLSAADVGARPSTWTPTASQVGALPITGGTLTGNLRIKNSANYGMKLNLGDGEYVYLHESSDDNLDIKAKTINFLCTNLRKNGSDIDGSGGVVSGTYAGTCADGETQTVNLGFRPKCVMIMRDNANMYDEDHTPWYYYQFDDHDDMEYDDVYRDEQRQECQFVILFDGTPYETTNGDHDDNTDVSMVVAEITSTGFLIGSASYSRMDTTASRDYYHKASFSMADSGRTYYYLAFR